MKKFYSFLIHLCFGGILLVATQTQAFPGAGCDTAWINGMCQGEGCTRAIDPNTTWACCDTNWNGCCQRLCQAVTCTGPGTCATDPPHNFYAPPGQVKPYGQVCVDPPGLCGVREID